MIGSTGQGENSSLSGGRGIGGAIERRKSRGSDSLEGAGGLSPAHASVRCCSGTDLFVRREREHCRDEHTGASGTP